MERRALGSNLYFRDENKLVFLGILRLNIACRGLYYVDPICVRGKRVEHAYAGFRILWRFTHLFRI